MISDVHCKFNKLIIPECDILLSTGDYSFLGEPHEVKNFHEWLNKQDAKHIISVQGNHEKGVEKNFALSKQIAEEACPRVHFIEEGLIELEGLKIWCSAMTPYFHNWAYNRYRGDEIKRHWDRIPFDIDALATHGPPYGILDPVLRFDVGKGEVVVDHVGCKDLLDRIKELKNLKLHCFGHLHSGYGIVDLNGVKYANAAICDENYKPSNIPIVVEL